VKKKAYVLISGGLDSSLVVKMLQKQDIDVTGVYVSTGFCISAQQKRNGRFSEDKKDITQIAEELGVELEVIDISQDYISIVTNPKYGWGKNVNPCIDCRIHMLEKTRELMEQNNFDFIATGEVLGQRPMSQRSFTQRLIEQKSGLEGYLLRPLSAQLMRETIPEQKGWVDRKKLGRIQGRSRKHQLQLAKDYQLQTITSPAGGCCYLTDENYGVRFKHLLNTRHMLLKDDTENVLTYEDMIILSIGRQINIRPGLKLICGRNEAENNLLMFYRKNRIFIETTKENPGPTGIVDTIPNENNIHIADPLEKEWSLPQTNIPENIPAFCRSNHLPVKPEELLLCSSLLARYSDGKQKESVEIIATVYNDSGAVQEQIHFFVSPFHDETLLTRKLVIKSNEQSVLAAS